MRDTFAAIQLVQADLYRGQELKPIRNLAYRRIVGKFSNGVEDHLFLRHRRSLGCPTIFRKSHRGLITEPSRNRSRLNGAKRRGKRAVLCYGKQKYESGDKSGN